VSSTTLAELTQRVAGKGAVLAIDASPIVKHLDAASVRELEAPSDETIALDDVHCDAAIVGGLGNATPLALARALRARIAPGGALLFALAGGRGAFFGMLRRRKPLPLEALCEALLIAGYESIEARELDRKATVVWGRVPHD
jgi:hypothetical protein